MNGLELHEAATLGDYDSLDDYVSSGRFDLNMKDPEWQNRTALHWACAKGRILISLIEVCLQFAKSRQVT